MGIFNSDAPRRDLTRKDLAKQGFAGLAFAVVLLILISVNATGGFSDKPRITAQLDDVGASIATGSDVKVNGVIVGKVTELIAREGGATLELTVDADELRGIPKNVVARVLPATVFGTTFVDLTMPPGVVPATERLQNNDTILQDKSQPTLEFQQALDDIDNLVKALGPGALNTALTSIAMALDGRGEQLGQTFELANSLLGRYNSEFALVRQDLELLAINLEVIRDAAPDLLQAVENGLITARTLVERRGQLTAILTGGLALARDAEQFIDRNGTQLTRTIRQAFALVDATFDNRQAGIVNSFDANSVVGAKSPNMIRQGQFYLNNGYEAVAPPYYTAADCPAYGNLRGNC